MVTGGKILISIGMRDYILTDRRKILADLENNATIILNTKKVLYLSKLDKNNPHLKQIQSKWYTIMIFTSTQLMTNSFFLNLNGLYC